MLKPFLRVLFMCWKTKKVSKQDKELVLILFNSAQVIISRSNIACFLKIACEIPKTFYMNFILLRLLVFRIINMASLFVQLLVNEQRF